MILSARDRVVIFLEKFDDFKLQKKHLVVALITTEILGIFALVWYLRVPLTQKYLASPPKTYSITSFKQNQRYKIFLGDFITGRTDPSNKIIALIVSNEDKAKRFKARTSPKSTGDWFYQIPEGLTEGKYRLTVGIFTKDNGIVSIDNYKLTISVNNLLENNRFIKLQNAKESVENNSEDIKNSESFLQNLASEEELDEVFDSLQSAETISEDTETPKSTNVEKPLLDK